MFPIDPSKLPALRTRKALLVIDAQNDFLDDDGALPIHQPLDLPERIADLVKTFRANGLDIIWVCSHFEKLRSIHNEMIVTSDLPLGNGPSSASRGRGSRTGAQITPRCPESFLSIGANNPFRKSVRKDTPGVEFHPEIQAAVGRKDQVLVKTYYSAFKNEQILRLLRMRFVTELYICGSLTNIGVMATAYDAASHGFTITIIKDCCGHRSPIRHNAAIKQVVELTGCDVLDAEEIELLSSTPVSKPDESKPGTTKTPSRSSTPANNMYPSIYKCGPAGSAPAATTGDLQDSLEKLSIQDNASKPRARPRAETEEDMKGPGPVTDDTETGQSDDPDDLQHDIVAKKEDGPISTKVVSIDASDSPIDGDAQPPRSAPRTVQNVQEHATTTIEPAHSSNPTGEDIDGSSIKDSKSAAREEAIEKDTASPKTLSKDTSDVTESAPTPDNHNHKSILEKLDSMADADDTKRTETEPLCEGDSKVIFNILPAPLSDNIFEKIRAEVDWQRMSHQGGEVPRLVAVQGQVEQDGSMPVYRHPSDESPPLLPFTPNVTAIKEVIEKELGHSLNHALIQFYRHGNDYISEHSDKTLDIDKDSFICNVSLGAERTMILRTKRTPKPRDDDSDKDNKVTTSSTTTNTEHSQLTSPEDLKRRTERAPLPHNSLMKMGLRTNEKWLHGIRQDKRLSREKSPKELAFNGARISLTFRRIGTFLNSSQTLIWGQGATAKTRAAAKSVINGQTPQAVDMLRAFGRENQSSDFDWMEYYGKGFDVLHISASPRLFLSADEGVNRMVQVMLEEYGVGYARGSMASGLGEAASKEGEGSKQKPKTDDVAVKFVDIDEGKSTVEGVLAIMLYLDRVYGSGRQTTSASATTLPITVTTASPEEEDQVSPRRTKMQAKIDISKMYTIFQQALALSNTLRRLATPNPKSEETKSHQKEIKHLLSPWEGYTANLETEDNFLASNGVMTLADFAFWSVLHEVVSSDADVIVEMSGLRRYYERVKKREAVGKVLGLSA